MNGWMDEWINGWMDGWMYGMGWDGMGWDGMEWDGCMFAFVCLSVFLLMDFDYFLLQKVN